MAALQVTSVVSRQTHGAAGDFDIALPLAGDPGVECRSGGAGSDYKFVFTFTNDVKNGNANVDSGVATVSGAPVFSGKTMTVNLTGVANAQALTVSANGVTDQFLQVLPNTSVTAKMLIGDTTGSSSVNSSDIGQTKLQTGQPVSSSNFRDDVTVSGDINSSDVSRCQITFWRRRERALREVGSAIPAANKK